MTTGLISERTILDRVALIERCLEQIRALPLGRREEFFGDSRNVWTAESCLRRALEALFDVGRHVVAKAFARGVSEYKEVAATLLSVGVLSEEEAATMRLLAGYRNRLVHFYHEISDDELYEICSERLSDLEKPLAAIRRWMLAHPEKVRPIE